jgi:hypothetical protein
MSESGPIPEVATVSLFGVQETSRAMANRRVCGLRAADELDNATA